MNENDELQFTKITNGKINMSPKAREMVDLQKRRLESSSKKVSGMRVKSVDTKRREEIKTKKKSHKALVASLLTLSIYLIAVSSVTSNIVDDKYGVYYEGSGSAIYSVGKENIPNGAYLEEFIENLNPINLAEDIKDISNKSK